MRTKIKICGITNTEDAIAASSLDIDYIGLIFIPDSPRCVSSLSAENIVNNTSKNKVGVFMNQSYDDINQIIKSINLDIIQFHGNEDKAFCSQFKKPFFKTISVDDKNVSSYDESIDNFIIDTSINGISGGTGKVFDWSLLESNGKLSNILKNKDYLVAGGLNIDNIKTLLTKYNPAGLDLSSGLEYNIGKKDIYLMERFVNIVRKYDLTFNDEEKL